jgi:hypothetical protein
MSTSFEDIGTQAPNNPNQNYIDPRVLSDAPTEADLGHQTPEASGAAQNGVGEQMADTAMRSIDGPNSVGGKLSSLMGSNKIKALVATGATLIGAGAVTYGVSLGNSPMKEQLSTVAPANPNDLGHDINAGDTIVLPAQSGEVYSLDELETMSAEKFKTLDANNQLRFLGEPIYDHVDSVKPFMKDLLSAEQLAILKLDEKLPKDKRNYTDQQILNEYAKILFYADSQGADTKDGRKTLNVIIDANKLPDQYDNASERVGDAIGAMTDVKLVDASYPPLVNTTFRGVPFGGDGGRTIEAHMVKPDGSVMPNEQLTFQLIQFEGHEFWRLVDSANPIEAQSDLQEAFPPSK